MEIIRMRLKRVVDFGPVVSLSGVELTTQQPMTVHLDYCPSLGVSAALRASPFAPPMAFDAKRLVLSIDVGEQGAADPPHEERNAGGSADPAKHTPAAGHPLPETTAPANGSSETPRPKRFDDALMIVNPGACNPSGIAHAIIAACREARTEGIGPASDVAVRLMVTQLAWVCRADSDTDDYGKLLAECLRRAAGL